MRETIQEEMLADVSISKIKRAKSIVMQRMFDATRGEYGLVFDYQLELLRSNPGSTIVVKLDTGEVRPTFLRFYVCFDACKKGFLAGCRKVVGLDGCFFKGLTNGELLCALGRDANNQMYPIAWAVVEKENNDSWDFFMALLSKDLQIGDGEGWVIISDQQKGLINAVEQWVPKAKHRMCARHIYANWRKKFKQKKYQKLFWRCAKSSSMSLFNYNLSILREKTPAGADAIMRQDPHHWSRAWFQLGSFCDSVDNNMCESFNHWVLKARFLPIISMLEGIRRQVMVRIQENRSKADRWTGLICPNTFRKISTYIRVSGFCHALSNGANCFEVTHNGHRFTVNLNDRTCSCRFWQLSDLPCPHAISCIYFCSKQLDEFIAPCYYVSEYKKTYEHCMQPVEGRTSWPISDRERPLPPKYVKMPGRPKKERKREVGEKKKPAKGKMSKKGTIIRCRKCKGIGHNRSTCEKRTGSTSGSTRQSAPPPTDSVPRQSAGPSKFQDVVHTSQQSSTSNQKRKSTTTTSTKSKKSKTHCSELGIVHSEKTGATIQNVSHPSTIHILTTYALFLIN